MARLSRGVDLAVDAWLAGRQWMRGDEANETQPLAAYAVAGARLGAEHGPWRVALRGDNLFGSHRATFGTFNENRRTGALERFFTPLTARTFTLVARRRFGSGEADLP